MRPDTVAEAVAAHYGVSKSELLERHAGDLPLRMALGETHVIATTKKELGDAGAAPDGRFLGHFLLLPPFLFFQLSLSSRGFKLFCRRAVGLCTHVRTCYTDAGVDVAALEAAAAAGGSAAKQGASVARSSTTLLLKNLPWSTTKEELEALCGRAGDLARLVLPSTRTLALVEYLEPQDARTYVAE